jgi:murein DD-endopeptidase MepM/ murein hydrolase activator NlpD
MSWIMPFPEKAITGEYGTMSDFRRKKKMQAHSGTDWSPAGSNKGKTPIPAVAKGTIKLIQWSNILGWVIVQTAMDKDRKVKYIGYCHVSCGKHGVNCKGPKVHGDHMPIKKKVGDKLAAGDTVAIMGNTGIASSGVHLHATLSDRLKGVFGVTADKQDLKKAIKANKGVAPAKIVTPKPVAQPATPAPAPVPKDLPPIANPGAQRVSSIGGPENAAKNAPAPAPIPVVAPTVFHKVKPGENLTVIAAQYGADLHAIAKLNNIENINRIFVGQMVRIPDGK